MPPHSSMEDVVKVITAGGPSTCGTEVIFPHRRAREPVVLRDMDAATGESAEQAKYDPRTEPAPRPSLQAESKPTPAAHHRGEGDTTVWQVSRASRPFLTGRALVKTRRGQAPDTYGDVAGATGASFWPDARGGRRRTPEPLPGRRAPIPCLQDPGEALTISPRSWRNRGSRRARRTVAAVFVNRLRGGCGCEPTRR